MKKPALVCLLLVLLLLVSCTPTHAPQENKTLSLSYRGQRLTVGMAADALIAALGDDYMFAESESCAGIGVDRMYTYPSVRLYVFVPAEGEAVLQSVSYTDDGVQTEAGLGIGSATEAVIAVYGPPDEQSENALIYQDQNATLTFGVRDGTVRSITLSGV